MKNWNIKEIQNRIDEILPKGKVVPRHNKEGHFYEVCENEHPIYPSVTGKLQVLKDPGLMNYKMNRAIESLKNFMFSLINLPDMGDIDKACEIAGRVSQDILEDAGDIGTRIHDLREVIFSEWIKTGIKPVDFLSFIPPEEVDIRVTSGIRALRKFVDERDYIPVACELLVYSHEYKTAGTLDDLGLMRKVDREGDKTCEHKNLLGLSPYSVCRCINCDYKQHYEFVLMDIKTSNQLKDHYFFQVSVYWKMFWKLMGAQFKPEKCIIVQLSKENGTYKIEELKELAKLAQYSNHMIKTNEGIDFIKVLRKDNQRVVAPLMKL